jgi:hypothetical protein
MNRTLRVILVVTGILTIPMGQQALACTNILVT